MTFFRVKIVHFTISSPLSLFQGGSGSSLPVAPHPTSRCPESFRDRLQAGKRMPEENFQPFDSAHSRTHDSEQARRA
jgi:hypothetical protein